MDSYAWIGILQLVVLLGVCFYHKLASVYFLPITLGYLLISSWLFDLWQGPIGWLTWANFLVVSAVIIFPQFRQQWFTKKIKAACKRAIPNLSTTEQEALNAGTVWWEAQLFQGQPDWRYFEKIPAPKLTEEEAAFIDGPVNELCKMVCDYQVTHNLADLPEEIWQYLKEKQFFAMIIKKEYGGLEFSAYAQAIALQKISGVSGTLSITVGVPNSLGPGELLQHYGTEAQKQQYLPRLARGEEIPCFALTSPEAGSDAGSIPDFGVVCEGEWQGEKTLGMKLTWNKRYITLAPIATLLGLAFKLRDPDHLLGDTVELGITCALIPTNLEGVEIGRRHFPLNIPFQNGPTSATELFVPLDFIIGGPEMAGQGWRMLMECLSVGRGITLPNNSTGSSKAVTMAVGAYSRIRRQFKQPIGKLEGIMEPLARLGGHSYMMDSACQLTTMAIDAGEKPAVISAIMKYHCTQRAQFNVLDAMDISGGKGICMGPSNFLARNYQCAPIAVTVEGANILTRSMIIFGQGSIRCHRYLLKEIHAAHDDSPEALKEFDHAFMGHVASTLSHVCRSFWLSLTDGKTSFSPKHDETKAYYQLINRYSAHLALLSDLAMATLGGKLKRKERLSARLGDILSQLYLCSATLKRFEMDGAPKADLPLVEWALQDSLYRVDIAIHEFLRNFPVRPISWALRVLVMPLGMRRQRPHDSLDNKVAALIQTPCETRDRIGRNQYLEPTEYNSIGKVESALKQILRAEPIFDQICDKMGKQPFMALDQLAERAIEQEIISQSEAEILIEAEQARLTTINVDDFSADALAANA